jgi:AcrR family transcriptional regulator
VFSASGQTSDPRPRDKGSRLERQQQFRDATRRAILDAALDLFVVDGYASVSIRSIAAKVEYSPAAIYGYFPSKDDIFFALAEEGLSRLGHQELSAEPAVNPLDDVRAMLWRFYAFSKEQPQYFALVFLDRNVPRISKEYERFAFMSALRDKTIALMQRSMATGALPGQLHIGAAMRLLFAPIIGLATLRLSNRLAPWEDDEALVRQSIDITLAGFVTHPPEGSDPPGAPPSPCVSNR